MPPSLDTAVGLADEIVGPAVHEAQCDEVRASLAAPLEASVDSPGRGRRVARVRAAGVGPRAGPGSVRLGAVVDRRRGAGGGHGAARVRPPPARTARTRVPGRDGAPGDAPRRVPGARGGPVAPRAAP